jgi:DNA-binding NarL/FixJ family response regulator
MSKSVDQPTRLKILIVDDHELVLDATVSALKQQYANADIVMVQNSRDTLVQLKQGQFDLVIVDLSMPEAAGETAQTRTGIQLLKTLMEEFPRLNIVVQSAHTRSLAQLKAMIAVHEGGFTVADKSLPMREMLTKLDWSLQGLIFTPKDMRHRLEIKPEWLEVIRLAFQEGLQDRAIAERMHIAERTVRHYWTKIQDALEVYPDQGKNMRIQTEIQARLAGLVD